MSRNRPNILLSTLSGAAAGTAAAWALLPGSTPPIHPKQKGTKSVATLEPVAIGGSRLWVLQRGADVSNPILLYVHGGPGTSELTFNRWHSRALEQDFIVVNWDQRGAGKSHKAMLETDKMHISRFVEDIREVAQYLLQKFGKQKLTLVGRSWGSVIGLLAVARYPGLFDAYVGIGQLTHVHESELASYEWALQQAFFHGDEKGIRELSQMGPPPYTGDWLQKFITQRHYVCHYGGEVKGNPHGGNLMLAKSALLGCEYTFADRMSYFSCGKRSMRLLQPELMLLNLFQEVPAVEVPVFFMAGRHDRVVPQQIAHRYFEALQAPLKEWHWFERAAHIVDVEEKEKFQDLLRKRVRAMSQAGTTGQKQVAESDFS